VEKYTDQQERVLRNSIRLHNALREIDALDVGDEYGVWPEDRHDAMALLNSMILGLGDLAAETIPGGGA